MSELLKYLPRPEAHALLASVRSRLSSSLLGVLLDQYQCWLVASEDCG